MSDTGKQSPLGVNVLSSLLLNQGLCINKIAEGFMGVSRDVGGYSLGTIVNDTCLRVLTYSINRGYNDHRIDPVAAYKGLYQIGQGSIPALGNSKAPTFTWAGAPKWNPYVYENGPITSWGYIRLFALQAWMEFNYNETLPEYRDFLASFMQASSFVDYSNTAITAMDNSKKFLEGTFSNMNDLMTADVTGISTATKAFGQDLINSGKVINLSTIASFGLPSNLLQTLAQNNASTQAVSLALLASGLTTSEISSLSSGVGTPTKAQQTKIYQAFALIREQDLKDVLVPLNCALTNLTTLCDLINPKLLFPTSFSTLTVPVYNTSTTPTNSKTYYLLYSNGAVNSQLSLTSIKEQIGTTILPGSPNVVEQTTVSQTPAVGFGSYLDGMGIPADIMIAAGSFGTAMQQVRNLASVPIEKFALIVSNLETTSGLAISTSKVPTDQSLVAQALPRIALGSGPVGTYTMSNFFGCMSGLPYPWRAIQGLISSLENPNLYRCYDEQFLAVTWRRARGHVELITKEVVIQKWKQGRNPRLAVPAKSYDPPRFNTNTPHEEILDHSEEVSFIPGVDEVPGKYEYWWLITGIVLDNPGGGYWRGVQSKAYTYQDHAPAPLVKITGTSGATARTKILGNDNYGSHNNAVTGRFGQVVLLELTYAGVWVKYKEVTTNGPYVEWNQPDNPEPLHPIPDVKNPPNPPLVEIEGPPLGDGGSNCAYDPNEDYPYSMNAVVQEYTNQANAEIARIKAANKATSDEMNLLWNSTGTQLTLEQRARTVGLTPVPVPRNNDLSAYPMSQYSFVDSMPGYAKQIKPHMQEQTIEAILDMATPGGQSAPAAMRESRNAERLIKAGIALDNNIEPELPTDQAAALIGNGSLPMAVPGSGIVRNGVEMTVPAVLEQMTQLPVDTSAPTQGQQIAALIGLSNTVPATITIPASTPFGTGPSVPIIITPAETNPYQVTEIRPQSTLTTYGSGLLLTVTSTDATTNLLTFSVYGGMTSGAIAVGTKITFSNVNNTTAAGAFVTGRQYTIASLGTTNFTLVGAASNTVGLTFTATGCGTGTGYVNEVMLGGLVKDQAYYVISKPSSTTIKISATFNGPVLALSTSSGFNSANAYTNALSLSLGNQTTADLSPGTPLTFGRGNAGLVRYGLQLDTIYYVLYVVDVNTFTISETIGGTIKTLDYDMSGCVVYVDPAVVCDSTAKLSANALVQFSNMNVLGVSTSTFGSLVSGTTYKVKSILDSTRFTLADTGLSTVEPSVNTGCMMRSITASNAANITLANTVYANVANVVTTDNTITLPIYTDPGLTLPVDGGNINVSGGIVYIQIGTLYVITTAPDGYYDPTTQQYITTNGPVPNGGPTAPGSFAGNPYKHLIPPELDTNLGSNTLLPSTPSIQEAINQIITCNCDSWAVA